MDYRQHIYLILKEAINNLVKYAGRLRQRSIEVRFDDRHLQLCVRDNGQGFAPSGHSTGNGISGMYRRAAMMNARVTIASAPGQGTSIQLEVDLV
jgi:two-component system sensor histidine kinase UhpB